MLLAPDLNAAAKCALQASFWSVVLPDAPPVGQPDGCPYPGNAPGKVAMMLPPLDLPTLLLASALGIAFAGLMLLLSRGRDGSAKALALWGAAMILSALGFTIFVALPLPSPWPVVTGDAILVTGGGLCWAGARVFAGRAINAPTIIAGALLLVALAILQRPFNTTLHLTVTLLLVAAYTIATAAELRRHRLEPLRSRNAAILLMLVHAAFQITRVILMVAAPAFHRAHIRTVYAAVFMEGLLFAIGISSVLLSMMKERAEYRSTVQLRQLTMVDELTGLGNRRRFDEALDRETQRAIASGQPLALLMIDVDHFKMYNDTYGHLPGDDCLRAIAGAISRVANHPRAVATRYGGEEFAVLLPNTDENAAIQTAERIHASIAALRVDHATSPYGSLTISIGVAAISPGKHPTPHDHLIKQADWALYVAKSEGRNATRAASESKDTGVLRPMA
jgi:diguanylate cyclase (GGDEF)-like protein